MEPMPHGYHTHEEHQCVHDIHHEILHLDHEVHHGVIHTEHCSLVHDPMYLSLNADKPTKS